MARPRKTTCLTDCIAQFQCPYCKQYVDVMVMNDYPHDEKVRCPKCDKAVVITEEE